MSPPDPTPLAANPPGAPASLASAPESVVSAAPALPTPGRTGWASLLDLTGYHWFVFVVAALGWLADCMDQQLFVLARENALMDLLHTDYNDTRLASLGGYATSIFLIGWATGGLAFGIMGDVFGRVRTMMLTILLYSIFTGLSALSVGVTDFMMYRFLTGLGVGGEFAVGVALLAETMPAHARPFTLGLLQAFSALGNVTAAFLYMWFGRLEQAGVFEKFVFLGWSVKPWRILFLIGMVPALLAVLVRRRLREPEALDGCGLHPVNPGAPGHVSQPLRRWSLAQACLARPDARLRGCGRAVGNWLLQPPTDESGVEANPGSRGFHR